MNDMFETTQLSGIFNELARKKDYRQLVYAAERMYGTGGFGNALAFCVAVEGAGGIIVTKRAEFIRTIFMELSLAQENLLRLASITEYLGFENLSMMCWSYREDFLEIIDRLSGNRMISSICKAGGVRRDFDSEILDEVSRKIKENIPGLQKIRSILENDRRIASRTKGIGYLSKEEAEAASVTGPAAKGSGIAADRRSLGEYGAYEFIGFEPIVETGGDCYARCMLKAREIIQSAELVALAIEKMPEGSISVDAPERISGTWIARVEQADGMDTFYIRGTDSAFLEQVGVRRASESNDKIMYRVTDYRAEDETLVRLSLGIDDCLDER